ncbi:MAG TPA: decaprenyl-phosphate phosphoribosyltransferase [Vicinamibacterales bacterium]|nr:decaprenyl-phosphate phosphoribosyltransferase [Vicinamibacterales bacterium]
MTSSATPAVSSPVGDSVGRRSVATHLLHSLRPSQWTKNLFVFAGLIFAERLFDPVAAALAMGAFFVFCALSGVVYLVNDIQDREADRRHPIKSHRPIASGAISPSTAATTAVTLGAAAILSAFWIDVEFGIVALIYVTLLTLYSVSLKHIVILDVLTIAGGFVLRALGGAVAIDVRFSHWLLLLMLLLALFLALSKRRAELVMLADDAKDHRPSLAEYSPYLLDQMIGVVTASTLLAYAFYTIAPDTVARFGTDRLLWTVPFPLYGIFRYLYLVHQREGGGNPSELLLTDRPLLACVALWGLAVIAILYGPWR